MGASDRCRAATTSAAVEGETQHRHQVERCEGPPTAVAAGSAGEGAFARGPADEDSRQEAADDSAEQGAHCPGDHRDLDHSSAPAVRHRKPPGTRTKPSAERVASRAGPGWAIRAYAQDLPDSARVRSGKSGCRQV